MKCKLCGNTTFVNITPDRPYRVCSSCEAMERHRALWDIMKDSINNKTRILDISPLSKYIYGGFLRTKYPDIYYIGVDKYRNGNPMDRRDSAFCDIYFDIVDMHEHLDPCSFDIVIMQHVVEEIEDYKKCIVNINGVLVDGGVAYLEIPNHDFPEHIKSPPNKFGNIWQFSKKKLYYELKDIFRNVDLVYYSECGYDGNFFVCKK